MQGKRIAIFLIVISMFFSIISVPVLAKEISDRSIFFIVNDTEDIGNIKGNGEVDLLNDFDEIDQQANEADDTIDMDEKNSLDDKSNETQKQSVGQDISSDPTQDETKEKESIRQEDRDPKQLQEKPSKQEIKLNETENDLKDENMIIREQLEKETRENIKRYNEIILDSKAEMFSTTSSNNYQLAIANSNGSFSNQGSSYANFNQAKNAMNANSNSNIVVLDKNRKIGNQVVAMKDGIVVIAADKLGKSTLTFNFPNSGANTYVNNGNDAFYYDSTATTVEIGISGQVGAILSINEVELIPRAQVETQSYYGKNSGGDLYHSVAVHSLENNRYKGTYGTFTISKAPSFMKSNTRYYSLDGTNFYTDPKLTNLVGTYYPYFKFLPFRSKTSYSADDLNRYINSWGRENSVLFGEGRHFIEAQKEFGVNAALLLAFAAHESGYGTSAICRNKNNLFGVNATDDNPYGNADTFNSVKDSIMNQAENWISRGYLDSNTDGRYFGSNVGNKNQGMNVKYASDPYWGEKIAGHIYRLDKYLGDEDDNKYQLAVSKKITNARRDPSANAPIFYRYSSRDYSNLPIGMPILITNVTNNWYEIQSDMGIDSTRTAPALFSTIYVFEQSKTYVASNDFTLINNPPSKYIDPATEGRSFKDVDYNHWAFSQIENLARLNIINGYEDDSYKPNNNLTRAQAAVIIVNASGIDYKGKVSDFIDVTSNNWASAHIAAAKDAGIVNGYGDRFKPNENLTRAQASVLVSQAFNLKSTGANIDFKDVSSNNWAYTHIQRVAKNKIATGYEDGSFKPNDHITRAQFAVFISEALKLNN